MAGGQEFQRRGSMARQRQLSQPFKCHAWVAPPSDARAASSNTSYKFAQRLTGQRTSTQAFLSYSPISMPPSLPFLSGTLCTCSILSRKCSITECNHPPKKRRNLSSLDSGHMERNTWRRSSERRWESMSRTVARNSVPASGPNSTSFQWCCPNRLRWIGIPRGIPDPVSRLPGIPERSMSKPRPCRGNVFGERRSAICGTPES